MPPSAAPEWLRVGWIFETSATSAPASWASIAARIPAQPAPITTTSCFASTATEAIETRVAAAWLHVRARSGHLGARLGGELAEVVAEHGGQLARLPVVRLRLAPGRARVEERRVDARHLDRHLEPEELVGPGRDALERAGQCRVEQRPGRRDRHSPPLAERTPRPAGVHEPDRRAVPVELLAEHPRVDPRRLGEERGAEARREGRLRLGDADIGAGELRGEAREEVEERLVAVETRDRRQDAEGVRGQEVHRLRMAGTLLRQRVRDLLQLV